MSFQTEERVVRVNKGKITCENTFNGDHFEIEGNHESGEDEGILFLVFLQIFDLCFNPWIWKFVYLRFWSIVWSLESLGELQWVLEARSRLTFF